MIKIKKLSDKWKAYKLGFSLKIGSEIIWYYMILNQGQIILLNVAKGYIFRLTNINLLESGEVEI